MSRYVWDCETNGLLHEMDKVHCLVLQDLDTDEVFTYANGLGYPSVEEGLRKLMDAEEHVGHNLIRFDLPALQKIYPWFAPKGLITDTLVLSRLFWPEIGLADDALIKRKKMKPKLRGRYSLEAFGVRLGEDKGDYSEIMKERGLDPWAKLNQEMVDYNVQDVVVNRKLYDYALKVWRGEDAKSCGVPFSDRSVRLEMDVQTIIARQERWGFGFDVDKAAKFYASLVKEREELLREVTAAFPPWYANQGLVTPKTARAVQRKDLPPIGTDKKGNPVYPKEHFSPDAPYTKIVLTEFNPSSGAHIEKRLRAKYNWEPVEFTPSGQAKTDESTLSLLPYPEAKALTAYMTVAKRIGQLAEGQQAWLKREQKGRLHGTVVTLGAVTRRMTHNTPNLAQVPKVKKGDDKQILRMAAGGYGAECRELFTASPGFELVGCDADALELRCLAGYMAPYDGGEYIRTVLSGDKANGTDMHSVNCRALGMDPQRTYDVAGVQITGRDIAKTWFYAFIYGAGDFKLGSILGTKGGSKAIMEAGKKSKADFMAGLPALGKLVDLVVARAFGVKKKGKWIKAPRGFVVGLDGGKIRVRHRHAALNTLLQSAGAIIMKMALVILDKDLQDLGMVPGEDYEFVANVHDEFQIDVRPQHVKTVMQVAEDSIRKAGEEFNFGCPLAGNADTGKNWCETH